MNDDETLSQFRKPPRPEFAQSLYQRLSKIEGETMNITSRAVVYPPKTRPLKWDLRLMLVAGTLIMLVGVVALTLYRPSGGNIPSVTSIPLQAHPAITSENAEQVEHLAQLGKGNASGAIWSPDGQYVVIPGSLGIWIYDAADLSKPLYLIEQTNTFVSAITFSKDGSKLAFSTLGSVVIWDMAKRENVTPELENLPASVSAFAFSPDGKLLALGDYEGRISIYDAARGALTSQIEVFYQYVPIWGLGFNQDGTRLAFTSSASPLLVIDDPTGAWQNWEGQPTVFRTDERSELVTRGGRFSPDGKLLAARVGNFVVLWDAQTGEETGKIDTNQPLDNVPTVQGGGGGGSVKGGGGDITFSPDSQQIATVDETVRIWDVVTGTGHTVIEGQGAGYGLGNINFSPDWTQLSQVGIDGVIHFIDLATGEEVATIDDYTIRGSTDLVFAPDGNQLVSAADSGGLHLWDITDLSAVPDPVALNTQTTSIYGLQRIAYSPDGKVVATYLPAGDIQLWDAATGAELAIWRTPDMVFNSMGFGGFIDYNADGSYLASTSPDGSVIWLWDTTSGEVTRTIKLDTQTVSAAKFSPDGKTLAVGVGPGMFSMMPEQQLPQYQMNLYDVETGELLQTLTADRVDMIRSIAYSPDGTHLVSVDNNGRVVLWDAENGQLLRVVQETGGGLVVAFSPDGSLILTLEWSDIAEGGRVNLWNAETGERLTSLQHEAGIQALAMSDNGALIATGAVDGTIHLWGIR